MARSNAATRAALFLAAAAAAFDAATAESLTEPAHAAPTLTLAYPPYPEYTALQGPGRPNERGARATNLGTKFDHGWPAAAESAVIVSGPVQATTNRATNGWAGDSDVWLIRLGTSQFKVSIEQGAKMTIAKALSEIEQLPALYRKAFVIVSEEGKDGVAWFKSLAPHGGIGHGSQDYINLSDNYGSDVLAHEAGHTLDQRFRELNGDDAFNPVWQAAIASDGVSVSWYGDGSFWEDFAEYTLVYGQCAGAGVLSKLQAASPERFRTFELVAGVTYADSAADFCARAKRKACKKDCRCNWQSNPSCGGTTFIFEESNIVQDDEYCADITRKKACKKDEKCSWKKKPKACTAKKASGLDLC